MNAFCTVAVRRRLLAAGLAAACLAGIARQGASTAKAQQQENDPNMQPVGEVTLNLKDDGYRGIWYMNQATDDEYVYKYSGGLGTYCDYHQPFAIYRPEVNKTFFCYGGTAPDNNQRLRHMVSYYDHATGTVPRPTYLLDKRTSDAHDNPVLSIDRDGYLWIFSSSHGLSRPSYIHRSKRPYDIDEFEQLAPVRREGDQNVAIDNYSYPQFWYDPDRGFVTFFTRYSYPAARTSCFMSSPDGVNWSEWQRLAAIAAGHYQTSAICPGKAGTMMNYHPAGKGLNWRTNLYYLETLDNGASWQAADGTPLDVPLTEVQNPALVHDYEADGLLVYLKDMVFDADRRPILVYETSLGYEPGPDNGPRTLCTARWTGEEWVIFPIADADHNYDSASLYLEDDGTWRVITPTAPGPQPYGTGGEMEMWVSSDQGKTWTKERRLTHGSPRNHTYARRPVNAHPDFYAFWADGNAREPSESVLYFCNKQGDVFRLPREMDGDSAQPERVHAKETPAAAVP